MFKMCPPAYGGGGFMVWTPTGPLDRISDRTRPGTYTFPVGAPSGFGIEYARGLVEEIYADESAWFNAERKAGRRPAAAVTNERWATSARKHVEAPYTTCKITPSVLRPYRSRFA